MRYDIFTLFPEMFAGVFSESIIGRAQERDLVSISCHNIRDYTTDKHHITDDTPYGGGGGMIMKPDPIFRAVEGVLGIDIPAEGYQTDFTDANPPIILLSPQGRVFSHTIAQELSAYPRILFICGRYEGIDERVRQYLCTDQISIGDYVLSGGEIAAMAVVDALVRLIPQVLGDVNATADDSHATGLLEYPHYTRPADFRGHGIPDILLSGHHANIDRWRRHEALRRTLLQRPDLLETADLSPADKQFLEHLYQEYQLKE